MTNKITLLGVSALALLMMTGCKGIAPSAPKSVKQDFHNSLNNEQTAKVKISEEDASILKSTVAINVVIDNELKSDVIGKSIFGKLINIERERAAGDICLRAYLTAPTTIYTGFGLLDDTATGKKKQCFRLEAGKSYHIQYQRDTGKFVMANFQ